MTKAADLQLLEAVRKELAWAPEIDDGHLISAVTDGVAELTGEVPSLDQVRAASRAALRVKGISAVANDLCVRTPFRPARTDREIARAVRDSIFWSSRVPRDCVQVVVSDRVVTLTGGLDWNFQRQEAERIAEHTMGVIRVDNRITLPDHPVAADAAERIRDAFERAALLEADGIQVSVAGNEVILRGTVSSHAEKADAGRAAWSTPYVTSVMNLLDVKPES
ncbi:MAG: BON domain-containing protein [Actinobacteria bacterium]|nr:BON domain-containing protein [Actinomycetota bacterium]